MAGPKKTDAGHEAAAPKGGESARFEMQPPLIYSDDEDDDQDGGAKLTVENGDVFDRDDPAAGEDTDSTTSTITADDEDDEDSGEDSGDDGGVLVANISYPGDPIVVSATDFLTSGDPAGSNTQHGDANGYGDAGGGYAHPGDYVHAGGHYVNGYAYAGGHHANGYAYAGGQGYVNGYQHENHGYDHGDPLALHAPDNNYYGGMQDDYNAELPVLQGALQRYSPSIPTCPTPYPSPQLRPVIIDVVPPRFELAGSELPVGGVTSQSAAVAEGRVISHNDDAYVSRQEVVEIRPMVQAMASHIQAPVPNHIQALRSEHLNRLTSGPTGRPTLDVALDAANFPFIQGTTQAAPVKHGVVKIKNIPFSTKRAEIIAFLGRKSKILNDSQEPVHVIMERITSKTHDVYVEFLSMNDAMRAVEKHSRSSARGKPPRLGDRPVDVELSSQANMMKDLFPLARGIFWDGSIPRIQPINPREPWENFKGFITEEEMTMLAKHVEIPQRSPFSRDCLQRAFECMISTIKKVPWYMAELITIKQRYAMYKSTLDLIVMLQVAVSYKRDETLTMQLLRRLVTAAMLCPGFTVTMKDDIAFTANLDEIEQRGFNQPRFADSWCHAYTLAPKPGIPLDVLEWYIAIIREETIRYVNSASLSDRALVRPRAEATSGYFGYFWLELSLPAGRAFDRVTLADVAEMEFNALERIFARAFPAEG